MNQSSQEKSPERRRRVLAEVVRRAQRSEKIDFSEHLFGPQKTFVESPAKLKAALCSRRSGKTHGVVLYMLKVAYTHAFSQTPYITLTRAQGKRNIWPLLKQLDRQLDLHGTFNNNELTYTLPNGSHIFICGANDESEIDRLRGGRYHLAVIDEAQSFRPLISSLIADVLDPALLDYRGTLCITGTPGPACVGLFFEVTTQATEESKAWEVHRWTILDNERLPTPVTAKDLEDIRKRRRWLPDNPSFVREYLGRWVFDDSALVYKWNYRINALQERPDYADMSYVLALDLGYVDSTAFVVMGYSEQAGVCVAIESYKESGLIPSAVAVRVEQLSRQYDFEHIVADSGGLGKAYVEEMRQRYGLNIISAQKTNKLGFIELLNGDFQSGAFRVVAPTNPDLLEEVGTLPWNKKRDGEDERFENHLTDAMLYGWRACKQYFYEPEFDLPKPGSEEALAAEEDRMEEAAEEALIRSCDEFSDYGEADLSAIIDEFAYL